MPFKFIIITIFLLVPEIVSGQAAEDEYEIVSQNEKIILHERWNFFPGTTLKARNIKGVFQTSASLDKLYELITEEAKIREWQTRLVAYRHIPICDSTWYAYSMYEIPWPMNNQDYFLIYTLKERTENAIMLAFQYYLNEKLAPIQENVNRTPTIGQWQLEKLSNGKTQVIYTVVSKPNNYPRFFTDRIVRNSIMNTLNMLIEVAEKN